MNKYFLLLAVLIFSASNLCAQKTFSLKNASKNFDVKIEVEKCENGFCEGKAAFSLFKKDAKSPFQIIRLENTNIWLDENGQAQANVTLLYDEQSAVNFSDFNFDGLEDIAVCDGTNGSYGMPSYQVYLYSKQTGKFVKNNALTKLASENLGMFEIDKKKRTIETFDKSGCCWHETTRYKFVNNRFVKIYVFTEDASRGDDKVRLITETLVGKKWKKTTKVMRIKDYYEDEQ